MSGQTERDQNQLGRTRVAMLPVHQAENVCICYVKSACQLKYSPGHLAEPATPSFTTPMTPTFGRNQNVPFLFNTAPIPSTPHTPAWTPPVRAPQPELPDIDMNEVTPSKPETTENEEAMDQAVEHTEESNRPVALGALRRVYKQRRRTRGRSRRPDDHDDSGLGSTSEEDEDDRVALRPTKTSNHYTLNMPGPAPAPSETPYLLLGYDRFVGESSIKLISAAQILTILLQLVPNLTLLIPGCAVHFDGATGCREENFRILSR